MSVDSALLYFGPSCSNSFFLFWFVRFMILWKFDDFSVSAQCSSWISSIGDINGVLNHKNDISSASNRINNFTVSCEWLKPTFDCNFFQFFFAFLTVKELIKRFESLLKSCLVFLFDKVLVFIYNIDNVSGTEFRDFNSSMPVKNGE